VVVAALEEGEGAGSEELDWVSAETRVRLEQPTSARPSGDGHERRTTTRERGNGYSDSILTDLSAHRTAALRELVAGNPDVAMQALLHALAVQLLYAGPSGSCLRLVAREVRLDHASQSVAESRACVRKGSRADIGTQ
jgi:ParB family chromosome partitioning protein